MESSAMHSKAICSKDTLVKVLAAAFLNPADDDRQGAKIFIQNFLGCGCPDEVVEKAQISFFTNPLGAWLDKGVAQLGVSPWQTPLEKQVNGLINIPKQLAWPRKPSGDLKPPGSWRRPALRAVAKEAGQLDALARLRQMCGVTVDAVIEVPGRAFFFLVAVEAKKPPKKALVLQYDCGQLLYKIKRYNRCRLFTISHADGPKIIPQIDTALTWKGIYDAFLETRASYPFADLVLSVFDDVG